MTPINAAFYPRLNLCRTVFSVSAEPDVRDDEAGQNNGKRNKHDTSFDLLKLR
jgi:hypothetical protein